VAVVAARSAVATTFKPVVAGVLAGTAALTVKEVDVRAVIAKFDTAYGAGAATETLSPTANAFVPEFVKVIVVPARLTDTDSDVVADPLA